MDVHWKSYQQNLTFVFCLTDSVHPFITSDRPSLLIESGAGDKEHIFVATPTLLVSTTKKVKPSEDEIRYVSGDEVNAYNKKIYDESSIVLLPAGIESVEEFT